MPNSGISCRPTKTKPCLNEQLVVTCGCDGGGAPSLPRVRVWGWQQGSLTPDPDGGDVLHTWQDGKVAKWSGSI